MDGNGCRVCGSVVTMDGYGDISEDSSCGVAEEGCELENQLIHKLMITFT